MSSRSSVIDVASVENNIGDNDDDDDGSNRRRDTRLNRKNQHFFGRSSGSRRSVRFARTKTKQRASRSPQKLLLDLHKKNFAATTKHHFEISSWRVESRRNELEPCFNRVKNIFCKLTFFSFQLRDDFQIEAPFLPPRHLCHLLRHQRLDQHQWAVRGVAAHGPGKMFRVVIKDLVVYLKSPDLDFGVGPGPLKLIIS